MIFTFDQLDHLTQFTRYSLTTILLMVSDSIYTDISFLLLCNTIFAEIG